MINSFSVKVKEIAIPHYSGEIKMLPFDLSNLSGVPDQFLPAVKDMISILPQKEGIGYLTIDGKQINKGASHRRPGAHIDGNFLHEFYSWGDTGGGNGWKVGEGGREINSAHHKRSYMADTGGMLIASDYHACRGWNGIFEGEVGVGGDCTHLELDKGFDLLPHTLYYGSSQFIHESLLVEESIHRTLVRVTLPEKYPFMFNIVK